MRPGESNDDYENKWKPLMTRVDLVAMQESFIGAKFPYNSPIFAKAIKELLNQKQNEGNGIEPIVEDNEQI